MDLKIRVSLIAIIRYLTSTKVCKPQRSLNGRFVGNSPSMLSSTRWCYSLICFVFCTLGTLSSRGPSVSVSLRSPTPVPSRVPPSANRPHPSVACSLLSSRSRSSVEVFFLNNPTFLYNFPLNPLPLLEPRKHYLHIFCFVYFYINHYGIFCFHDRVDPSYIYN